MKPKVIDVHTHLYPPRYLELMRDRLEVPKVVRREDNDFLVILPGEDDIQNCTGRRMDEAYTSIESKLQYMDDSGIDVSVLSLANPWLDFLSAQEAVKWAIAVNDDFERLAANSKGRLLALATLPTSAGVEACLTELVRVSSHQHVRGVILSTMGLGNGLDDQSMEAVWKKLVELDYVAFVHPHYGIGNEHYADYGHALYLAMGFPFETTVAAAKLALSGVLERFDDLKLMLAHGGGTIPYLAGRLDSCVAHDESIRKSDHRPSTLLQRAILDSVVYSEEALRLAIEFAGSEKVVFGTDHPFSISEPHTILGTIDAIAGNNDELLAAILGANASRILQLR